MLITHDLGLVAGMADRVLVMYAGKAVEQGRAADVFYRASHPYTLGLLSSLPRLDEGSRQRLHPIKGNPPVADQSSARLLIPPPVPLRPAASTLRQPGAHDRAVARCRAHLRLPFRRRGCGQPGRGRTGRASAMSEPTVARGAVGVQAVPVSREDPLLDVRNLVKHFAVGGRRMRRAGSLHAVCGISFELARGETLGLVGESGCGRPPSVDLSCA